MTRTSSKGTGRLKRPCTVMRVRLRLPLNRSGAAVDRPLTHIATRPTNRSDSNSIGVPCNQHNTAVCCVLCVAVDTT